VLLRVNRCALFRERPGLGKVSFQFHCNRVSKRQQWRRPKRCADLSPLPTSASFWSAAVICHLHCTVNGPSNGSELGPPAPHQACARSRQRFAVAPVYDRRRSRSGGSAISLRKICGMIERVSGSLSGSIRCAARTRSVRRHGWGRFESELYQRVKQFRKRSRTFGSQS
jgi:hypothetical protein